MLAFVGNKFDEEDVDYDPVLDLDSVYDVMDNLDLCGKMYKDDMSWYVETNIVSNESGRDNITYETMLSIELSTKYSKV
jgi:hypothetical protein